MSDNVEESNEPNQESGPSRRKLRRSTIVDSMLTYSSLISDKYVLKKKRTKSGKTVVTEFQHGFARFSLLDNEAADKFVPKPRLTRYVDMYAFLKKNKPTYKQIKPAMPEADEVYWFNDFKTPYNFPPFYCDRPKSENNKISVKTDSPKTEKQSPDAKLHSKTDLINRKQNVSTNNKKKKSEISTPVKIKSQDNKNVEMNNKKVGKDTKSRAKSQKRQKSKSKTNRKMSSSKKVEVTKKRLNSTLQNGGNRRVKNLK